MLYDYIFCLTNLIVLNFLYIQVKEIFDNLLNKMRAERKAKEEEESKNTSKLTIDPLAPMLNA